MHARSATRPVAASCCVAPSPSRAPGRAAGRRPHQRQAAAAAAHQAAAAPHRRHLPPPAAVAAAGQPSSNSAAAIPQASAQLPLADDQQLWEEVERCVAAAEALEGQGQAEEAIEMVQAALDDLQSRYGAAFGLTLLHQTLWDMLYAAGRHSEALRQAAAAHSAVQTRFGAGSAEVQMLAVRLGMSIAACGRLEEGLGLIYDATPVLHHNLEQLLAQAAEESLPDEEAAALQDSVDRLAAALGEGEYYGSLLTLRHAVSLGQQAGVVRGWEELEQILCSGFATLVAASDGGSGGGAGGPSHALLEHDRLTAELSGDALLARLLAVQNERLRGMVALGLEHPAFQQQE